MQSSHVHMLCIHIRRYLVHVLCSHIHRYTVNTCYVHIFTATLYTCDVYTFTATSVSNTTPSEPHSLPIVLSTYDWANADFQAINEYLNSFDWNWIFGYNFDADSIWLQFKSVLMSVISLIIIIIHAFIFAHKIKEGQIMKSGDLRIYVPVKFVSHTVKHNVRRYPKHIRKLLTRKRAAWRALKLNNTPVLCARYDSIANQCRLEITNFDVTREQRILDANNMGAFYRFVNKKLSSKSGIAPLMNVNGDLIFV